MTERKSGVLRPSSRKAEGRDTIADKATTKQPSWPSLLACAAQRATWTSPVPRAQACRPMRMPTIAWPAAAPAPGAWGRAGSRQGWPQAVQSSERRMAALPVVRQRPDGPLARFVSAHHAVWEFGVAEGGFRPSRWDRGGSSWQAVMASEADVGAKVVAGRCSALPNGALANRRSTPANWRPGACPLPTRRPAAGNCVSALGLPSIPLQLSSVLCS